MTGAEFERRLIIDSNGTEKVYPFPDKKRVRLDPHEIEDVVERVKRIREGAEVGQKEATWYPQLDYPDKPMLFLFLTDPHYTSIRSDHGLLNHLLDTVAKTPNMFLVSGGDDVDNFNVTSAKTATGTYENPIEPGLQARAWGRRIAKLDEANKIGFMVFGNHTDWSYGVGIDWYDTFLGHIKAPLLTSGGLVHVKFSGADYDIAATHKYWGTSKLNPTNANKRYLEHEYPSADIVLLGHTHQSEILSFERGGKERIACIGGTLKLYDEYARKHGYGGRAGTPGQCIRLWPDHKEMQAYKSFDRAVEEHIRSLK